MSAGTAIFLIFLIILLNGTSWRRDSTDDPLGERSGMRLYTDHRTGVQYVGTLFGQLTPRVKPDGSIYTIKDEP